MIYRPNQSMKPTAPWRENFSVCLPRHPAVAYLFLVRCKIVHKLILGAALMLYSAYRALCGQSDQPFDVSLASSRALDLSPYYQQVVREATESYRGDFPDGPVFYTWSSHTRPVHHFSPVDRADPISTDQFTSVSLQSVTPNQALELTATGTAFTFQMIKILPPHLMLDLGSRSSALSR
jgi:hypothetical protein